MKFNLGFYFYFPCTFHHLSIAPNIYHILSILKYCVNINKYVFLLIFYNFLLPFR